MMDKNAIRESGILERYLLGELSVPETREIEKILTEDLELKGLFQAMENDFERMAQENAINPPAHIKSGIMNKIEDGSVTTISPETRKSNNAYLAIAASLALLFGVSAFWMYNRVNDLEDQIRLVEDRNSLLEDDMENLVGNYDEVVKWYEAINDPNAIQLVLEGNNKAPTARAVSYLNHKAKTVILNASGLPKLAEDKDYQLWADVEGEMIDMGVIPKDTDMVAMTYIDNAESLNITIEPAGGNDHPTVEQLISNVYLE
ncbi:MAG: anti-sigma factor [Bacteroidota bacterium]